MTSTVGSTKEPFGPHEKVPESKQGGEWCGHEVTMISPSQCKEKIFDPPLLPDSAGPIQEHELKVIEKDLTGKEIPRPGMAPKVEEQEEVDEEEMLSSTPAIDKPTIGPSGPSGPSEGPQAGPSTGELVEESDTVVREATTEQATTTETKSTAVETESTAVETESGVASQEVEFEGRVHLSEETISRIVGDFEAWARGEAWLEKTIQAKSGVVKGMLEAVDHSDFDQLSKKFLDLQEGLSHEQLHALAGFLGTTFAKYNIPLPVHLAALLSSEKRTEMQEEGPRETKHSHSTASHRPPKKEAGREKIPSHSKIEEARIQKQRKEKRDLTALIKIGLEQYHLKKKRRQTERMESVEKTDLRREEEKKDEIKATERDRAELLMEHVNEERIDVVFQGFAELTETAATDTSFDTFEGKISHLDDVLTPEEVVIVLKLLYKKISNALGQAT